MPRASCLYAALALTLVCEQTAYADWPDYTSLGVSEVGLGAAIRNWAPTDEVFIVAELRDIANDDNMAALWWYTCSDGDTCDTVTVEASDGLVGSAISYDNLTHPSVGVHREDTSSPVELRIVIRQKNQDDCDGDTLEAGDGDVADQETLDLYAYTWDTTNGWGTGASVAINDTSPGCTDHGLSETRFLDGVAHSCATQIPGSPGNDQLLCDNESGASWQWINDLVMNNGFGSDHEDHPSFDFYGTGDDLVVSGAFKTSGTDAVRVHFPDTVAPPIEPIVSFSSTGNDRADHPSLVASGGQLYMVWEDNTNASAQIRYVRCDFSSTVDCTDPADWSTVSAVVDSSSGYNRNARFPQITRDGDNEFVVYQYDSNSGAGVDLRVMVASRCVGGSWTIEQVRTPSTSSRDQIVEVGRPSIVLNRDENIAHVAFAELDDYSSGNDFSTASDGTIYWYRKGYTQCP